MCGRISQAGDLADYVEAIGWTPSLLEDPVGPRYNVPPGTRPLAMHRMGDGDEKLDRLFWGYGPAKAQRTYSNAQLTALLKGDGFWQTLLQRGRVIVPVDGWYEWVGERPNKQAWFVHAKNSAPVLLAGISAWHPGYEHNKERGMAIVTDDNAGGMIDVHDRRPIALSREHAAEWLDPKTSIDRARAILAAARPESVFEWYRVTPAVGRSRYQRPVAIEPV